MRLNVGRLGSLSSEAAALCVTPPELELAGVMSVGPGVAGRFITGRSGSASSTCVADVVESLAGRFMTGRSEAVLLELSVPDESSLGPSVGFPLESVAGRFITGRSESVPLLLFELEVPSLDPLDEVGCPLLELVSPPDPGARFSTGRPLSASPVITASLGGFLARCAASLAALAFNCASIGNSGCHVPSATQLPFTCCGIVTVNVPVGSPKLCASYTVCGSIAMGSGFAPYKLAS